MYPVEAISLGGVVAAGSVGAVEPNSVALLSAMESVANGALAELPNIPAKSILLTITGDVMGSLCGSDKISIRSYDPSVGDKDV